LKTARYTGASNQLFKFKKAPTTKTTTTPKTTTTTTTTKPTTTPTTTKPTNSSQHPLSSVDALLDYTGHNGKVYFFKGNQYWRFNFKTKTVDSNYPAQISVGWKGLKNYPNKADFSKDLDAVVNRDNKHCYFFKDGYYIKWDIKNQKILTGYPAKISVGWKGLPSNFTNKIDAAYSRKDGKIYFFKGSDYIRYTVNTNKVDPGYPKKSKAMFDLGNFGSPKAATYISGESAVYFWDNSGKYFKYNTLTKKKFSPAYPATVSNKTWSFRFSGKLTDYLYRVSMVCHNSAESDRSVEIYGKLNLKISKGKESINQTLFSRPDSRTKDLDTKKYELIKKGLIQIPEGSTFYFSGSLSDEDDSPNPDDPLGSIRKTITPGKHSFYFKESDGSTKVEVILEIRKDEIQDYEKGNSISGISSKISSAFPYDAIQSVDDAVDFDINGTFNLSNSTSYNAFADHVQGITKSGKNWILSHDNVKKFGWILICPEGENNKDCTWHKVANGKSDHPGGIQACGSIVVVPMQNDHAYFIDISEPKGPITLDIKIPNTKDMDVGAAGLVYHPIKKVHYVMLGAGNAANEYLYVSNGKSLTSPNCTFTKVEADREMGDNWVRTSQGMTNLFYDPSDQKIYVVAMVKAGGYEEITYSELSFTSDDKVYVGSKNTISIAKYHGDKNWPGPSSRWGAGMIITDDDFQLFGIARTLHGGSGFLDYVKGHYWRK
jgi:hypothetical protein